jgi:hypothetical protein
VTVTSVESGCGCTKPTVEPRVVQPGGLCVVKFQATGLPVGERVVPLTVHTTSPKTPTVPLVLRIIGSRRPPFVLQVTGDLTSLQPGRTDDPRTITVITVETSPTPTVPRVTTDLPFITFDTPEISPTEPYTVEGTMTRRYRFPVRLTAAPSELRFAGTAYVEDPWDSSRRVPLRIQGEKRESIRLVPSPLRLGADGTGEFWVLMDTPLAKLEVQVAENEAGAIRIEHGAEDLSSKVRKFTVRHQSQDGRSEPGPFTIRVGCDGMTEPLNLRVYPMESE